MYLNCVSSSDASPAELGKTQAIVALRDLNEIGPNLSKTDNMMNSFDCHIRVASILERHSRHKSRPPTTRGRKLALP